MLLRTLLWMFWWNIDRYGLALCGRGFNSLIGLKERGVWESLSSLCMNLAILLLPSETCAFGMWVLALLWAPTTEAGDDHAAS